MPISLFILQYVTNTYGTFEFDDLNTKVFKSKNEAENAILQIAKIEYPDADPDVFEDIETLEDFLIRLLNDDKPALLFMISEISFNA